MNTHFKTRLFSLLTLAVVLGALLLALPAMAAKREGLVIFSAGWCANCRQVNPITQEVAAQNGMSAQIIDVDLQNAPSQAAAYGLSIPSAELPQVYYVNNGRVTLLFDGRQYKFGRVEAIRAALLQNLQNARSGN